MKEFKRILAMPKHALKNHRNLENPRLVSHLIGLGDSHHIG
jgi:hypothetical protein